MLLLSRLPLLDASESIYVCTCNGEMEAKWKRHGWAALDLVLEGSPWHIRHKVVKLVLPETQQTVEGDAG